MANSTQGNHMDKTFTLNDGMPTGPDVDLIIKKYPDLKPGDKMPREDLYALLGLDHYSERGRNRLRSVMAAFTHRMMRDHALVVGYDKAASAYCVLTAAQIMEKTPVEIEGVGRRLRRQRRRLQAGTRIATSEREQSAVQHELRLVDALAREARRTGMNVLPSTAAAEMPQIVPPVGVAQ